MHSTENTYFAFLDTTDIQAEERDQSANLQWMKVMTNILFFKSAFNKNSKIYAVSLI